MRIRALLIVAAATAATAGCGNGEPATPITQISSVDASESAAGGPDLSTTEFEDETGTVNIIVWPSVAEEQRQALRGSKLLSVQGTWQSEKGVHSLVALKLPVAGSYSSGSIPLTMPTSRSLRRARTPSSRSPQ